MTNEIIFTNLAELAVEQGNIKREVSDTTWQAVDYETEKYSGTLLLTTATARVEPITIPLGLEGWYKIYVAFLNLGNTYTYLKLDGDMTFTGLAPANNGNLWATYETIHEMFWKCEELHGDKLTISHPESYANHNSTLAWVRCIPMTEDETAEYKKDRATRGEYKIHAHIDTDYMGHDTIKTPVDALCRIQRLEGTDVTMLSQEVSFDACGYSDEETAPGYVGIYAHDRKRYDTFCEFNKIKDEAYPLMAKYAESVGIRLHAAFRMQMSSFKFPITYPNFKIRFADEHPEYYIKTRDGRSVSILSYAYPEVRDYLVDILVEKYKQGFHGISLLWIRGINIGFEEPVLKRVAEKYDGLDARTLPAADERLNSVWCEFITEMIRKLREKLDEEAERSSRPRCNLHSIGFYTLEHSKEVGLDVETWAREGLIDGVTVGMYAHHEMTDGILADDGSGLIDLEKYKEVSKTRYMVRRTFWMNHDMMMKGIEEHEALAEKYGIETFYCVDWEGRDPTLYADQAKEYYERGVKGVCLWDTNNRMTYSPGWEVTSKLGHKEYTDSAFVKEKFESLRHAYKLLRLNDHDLSYVNINWRG